MELVLVMDNTGSMRGNGGMDAMKPAATDLINILYGDRETVPQFWVGVVLYAASVNIGTQHEDWLTGYNAADFLPTTWKGCVEARAFPNDSNDATTDVELFRLCAGRPPSTSTRTLSGSRPAIRPWSRTPASATPPGQPHLPGFAQPVKPSPTKIQYAATTPSTWGRWLNGDNEWDPSAPESALKLDNDLYQNEGTGPISAAALRSRRWSRARPGSWPRSTRWRPGTAAAPARTSGSPGAGACCRRTGAAGGTATCRTSCRSTTRRPTWRRSSSC